MDMMPDQDKSENYINARLKNQRQMRKLKEFHKSEKQMETFDVPKKSKVRDSYPSVKGANPHKDVWSNGTMKNLEEYDHKTKEDTTADAIYKDDPLAKSSRKRVIEQPVFTGKGVIEHDSRKGPLAGTEGGIPRDRKRNNEHINYEDGESLDTWGG